MGNQNIRFKKYFYFMWKQSLSYFPLIIILQILTLGISVFGLYIADLVQMFIDDVLIKGGLSQITNYIIKFLVICIPIYLCGILNGYLNAYIINKVNFRVRSSFFESIQYHQYSFFIKKSASDIYYRMFQDVSSMTNFYISLILSLPIQIIFISIVVYKLISISGTFTIYAVILLVLQILSVILFKKPIKRVVSKQRHAEQEIVNDVNQQFGKMDTTKLLGIEQFQRKQFLSSYERYLKTNVRSSFFLRLFNSVTEFINQFWYVGVLMLSAFLIKNQRVSLGQVFSFIIISKSFFNPVLSIINTLLTYQECKIGFQRFFEYYEEKQPITSNAINFSFKDTLALSNVSFSYNARVIFQNVSLDFHTGELIAIKGESGIGKTTLFKIICKFLIPQEGCVTIDGVDINDINHDSYIHQTGFLPQISVIFDGSVYQNLTLDGNYEDDEINEVLKRVDLYDFIYSLPESLNTRIGLNGIQLSEGQLQRISLARLLLRHPSILWLDEPTAQLDQETKNIILRSINEYRLQEKALVVIFTHDPFVLHQVDKVYQIQGNRIVAE